MRRDLVLLLLGGIAFSAIGVQSTFLDRKPLFRQAPEKYVLLANPFHDDAEALQIGKRVYTLKCAKCHEANREGIRRGPDLDVAEIKTAPPGTLFWVLEKGNGDMPSFAKYPDKSRWQLVTFLQNR